MVSAVFHNPQEAAAQSAAPNFRSERLDTDLIATRTDYTMATGLNDVKLGVETAVRIAPVAAARAALDLSFFWMGVVPPLLGLGLLALVWEMVSLGTGASIPSPKDTLIQAMQIFSDPFYSKGPNDQGVGWNVLSSLKRVAMGFGMAAIVGIPVGFLIGRFSFLSRMFNPLISLMRPVSPLAWLPIGLLVFKGANPAAIWTIFHLLDLADDH